jgi:hypothetical protein
LLRWARGPPFPRPAAPSPLNELPKMKPENIILFTLAFGLTLAGVAVKIQEAGPTETGNLLTIAGLVLAFAGITASNRNDTANDKGRRRLDA